jgi:prepilin peptidase CpaA
MDLLALLCLGLFPVLMVVTGLHDLITMKIPNWISLSLLAAFFPAALLVGLPVMDGLIHLGVGFAALVAGMVFFALRWIGGGDAKVLAVACLWMGAAGAGPFLLWTAAAGGGFCLLLILARQYYPMIRVTPPGVGWLARLLEPKGDIPYGVAIALGALIAFPQGDLAIRFLTR